MIWLAVVVLLTVVVPVQLAVLGGMIPRQVVARAQIRVAAPAADTLRNAERAKGLAVLPTPRGSAKPPQLAAHTEEDAGGTLVVFTVEGEVPGRFARLYAHFIEFPRVVNGCVARMSAPNRTDPP